MSISAGNTPIEQLMGRGLFGRSFLVTESVGGRTIVHAARASMSAHQARQLARRLAAEGRRAVVRRHGSHSLARARSLESFLRPFASGTIAYDPTGVFMRAKRLVQFASEMRRLFPSDVKRILWQGEGGTLYVVLSRAAVARMPDDGNRDGASAAIRLVLQQACGSGAADFVRGVRIGYVDPQVAATPVDAASVVGNKTFLERLRDHGIARAAAALLGFTATGSVAMAQDGATLPAVSAVNGEAGVMVGERDGKSAFVFEGGTTIPIGDRYGMRLDGTVGLIGGEFTGGSALHLFWRDPEQGLLGIAGGYLQTGNVNGLGVLAGEGEAYLGDITLAGLLGYQISNLPGANGVVGRVDLEWYATEDLMFNAGAETNPTQAWLVRGGLEYRPGLEALPGLSLFAEGAFGENNYHRAYVGMRYYFGDADTLKETHRTNTFRTHLLPTRMTDSAARALVPAYGD